MVVIGLDPHKDSHTAAALDGISHEHLGSIRVPAGLAGYRRLLRWATRFEQRRWAVEGAGGLGLHVAQWLLAQNETVDDVLTTATARVRRPRMAHHARRRATTNTKGEPGRTLGGDSLVLRGWL